MSGNNLINEIRSTTADIVGNATETILHSGSEKLGGIPIIGGQAKHLGKGLSSKIARSVNEKIRGGNRRGNDSGNQPSGFGDINPPKNPSNGGNGGAGSGASPRKFDMVPSGGGYFPISRLHTNPEPYTFELNTGINAPVYSPLYQNATSNGNNSMLLGSFTIDYTPDSFQVSDFFQSVIVTTFSNAIQRSINFSIGSQINTSTLSSWMNALIRSLGVYFYTKSILAYTANPLNRNDGFQDLRNSILASDLNSLYELERILLGTPLPPNLVNFMWWLNNNYCNSELPGAMPLKLITHSDGVFESSTATFTANIGSSIVTSLSVLGEVQATSNLIARACPSWAGSSLPGYTDSLVYDGNWLSVFCNIPSYSNNASQASTVYKYPSLAGPTSSWQYNSYTNTLDGAALSLACAWDVTNNSWLPSLGSVTSFSDSSFPLYFSNRLVYKSNGVVSGWFDASYSAAFYSHWTYNAAYSNGNYQIIYPPGSQVVLGVNTSAVTQSAIQLCEWLISIDTIGYIKDSRVYDNRFDTTIGNRNYNNKKGRRK